MSPSPIPLFEAWYREIRESRTLNHPGAVCASTVDRAGRPEARFVDLKRFDESGFVFATSYDSPKGISLAHNSAVALTFWWDSWGRQVRIRGFAEKLSPLENQKLFHDRPRDAQLATLASRQSAILENPHLIPQNLRALRERFDGKEIACPDFWGGFLVKFDSIEFLTFRADRMHERVLYTRTATGWDEVRLQP